MTNRKRIYLLISFILLLISFSPSILFTKTKYLETGEKSFVISVEGANTKDITTTGIGLGHSIDGKAAVGLIVGLIKLKKDYYLDYLWKKV